MSDFDHLDNSLNWENEALRGANDMLKRQREEQRKKFDLIVAGTRDVVADYYGKIIRPRLPYPLLVEKDMEIPQAKPEETYGDSPIYYYTWGVVPQYGRQVGGKDRYRWQKATTSEHVRTPPINPGDLLFFNPWSPETALQVEVDLKHPWDDTTKSYLKDRFKAHITIHVWDQVKEDELPTFTGVGNQNAWNRWYSTLGWSLNAEEADKNKPRLVETLSVVTPYVLGHETFWHG